MVPTGHEVNDDLDRAHEEFIGTLEDQHRVVLGGAMIPPLGEYIGAYVLRCHDLAEARRVAAGDPLVAQGAITVHVVEWQLVAVDPRAVDRAALLYP